MTFTSSIEDREEYSEHIVSATSYDEPLLCER